MTQDNRNMIVAVLLSAIVLLGWTFASEKYFPQPKPAPAVVAATTPASTPAPAPTNPANPAAGVPGTVPAAPAASAAAASAPADRAVVLAATPRVAIATPRLQGSINLKGARFDDLVLVDYRVTIDPASPPVRLLSPSNTVQKDTYFSQFGWAGAGAPPVDADWTASAPTLTPARPVTLTWVAPGGVRYEQIIAVDRDFMFTVRQRVTNPGAAPLTLRPWGLVQRLGKGGEEDSWTLHIGALGVLGGTLKDESLGLEELASDGPQRFTSTGGWLGMTGKYWLTALVAGNKTPIEANFAAAPDNRFQADFLAAAVTIPAGASTETTARFFAGAKEVALLDRYTETLGIPRLDLAVSWGWFEIIAKPIYMLLHWLFEQTGNFGLAIIGLTILVRLALFPIANKQYESMAKMRIVAPRMKAIQERNKDDKLKAQQEMMALYKTEKVNPLAGCLPLVLQIPIFYALYKTLLVSTEMRHQPFALWIKDLSAPDPLTPLNLFGAIPWTPPAMIAIGIFPIILGVTMYLQQRMNPTPMDPVQKQVFAIMPWMFMFIMAPFAAGLQLYWIVNNIISIGQQWWMLKKYPMPATPPEIVDVKATIDKPTGKPTLVKPATPRK